MQTDIVTLSGDWPDQTDFYARLRDAVGRTIARVEFDCADDTMLSIALSDDRHIRALNREFRQKDQPTNVLAFPGSEAAVANTRGGIKFSGGLLGDIILASGVVAGEADREGIEFCDHAVHLIIHGLLHLLGYTHENECAAKIMEALEVEILKAMDISDPYGPGPEPTELQERSKPT